MCQPKSMGGLGIRHLHKVNQSLVLHSAWMIATSEDPMLTAILKAKYFHNNSFWKTKPSGSKSIFGFHS